MNYPLLAQKMPQRIKKVWQKSIFLTSVIFLLLGIIMFGILRYLHQLSALWGSILIGYFLIVLIVTILKFNLVPYRYEFHRYEITPEDLVFQKGFIFRSTTYVPINRIQHVGTEQGPFLRQQNLIQIAIHTAATTHRLAGLDMEEAQALRQQIIELVKVAKEDV
ncbi:PH domain-containing protein [Enterococcus durans]|uniref:PH domain-containing protein n=1 Tax=Enterococcus durans TaxID=53345 RepID=UPI001D0A748D|nr:PH domain-containing protein [Enterococcus durans]MCB8505741.1 PH domain-containing protein [Enterococcus durans]MCB8516347.1 PH domain-containing protein [Enterococcus durans]